jgi:hypothetical protein
MADILVIPPLSSGNSTNEVRELIQRTELRGMELEKIIELVNILWGLVKKGTPRESLLVPLEKEGLSNLAVNLIMDIAITRKRSNDKFDDGDKLFFTSEGLRWATPGSAADHCSRRLSRDQVMDVTCGQGGQLLSLSLQCGQVVGIDIEPLNCLMALMNCVATGSDNVWIVNGDCMHPSAVGMAENGCAIFSDPARPPSSSERTFKEIVPDPRGVMEAYKEPAGGMCFEVPPYMSLEQVDFPCEAEYVSLEGRLNRLNLYTGDLIKHPRSSVILPSGDTIGGAPGPFPPLDEGDIKPGDRIYEVDPSVVKAGLLGPLGGCIGKIVSFIKLDERRTLMSADGCVSSPFLKSGYRVMASLIQEDGLIQALRKANAGRVTLRYEMDPGEYWSVRNSLQRELSGPLKVHLFKGRYYLVLEQLQGGETAENTS